MRKLLLLTLAIVGACAAPGPSGPPMPSARTSQADGIFDPGILPPPACMTRWHWTDFDITVDCSTAFVDGDSHHYVTSCPVPPFLNDLHYAHPPYTEDTQLDAAGHLIHQVSTYDVPPNGSFTIRDTVNVYDASGLLQETTIKDGTEVDSHLVVTRRDVTGQTLTVSIERRPWVILGKTYPNSAHIDVTMGYDEIGRLSTVLSTIVATGSVFYDRTITYDDAARRRNFVTIVDFAEIDADWGTGPGDNRMYELLDENDLLVEVGANTPGDPVQYWHYRYDEQGRVVSEIATGGGAGTTHFTKSYIYDCP